MHGQNTQQERRKKPSGVFAAGFYGIQHRGDSAFCHSVNEVKACPRKRDSENHILKEKSKSRGESGEAEQIENENRIFHLRLECQHLFHGESDRRRHKEKERQHTDDTVDEDGGHSVKPFPFLSLFDQECRFDDIASDGAAGHAEGEKGPLHA